MDLNKYVLSIKDFPKKGINFRDVTPIFKNSKAFKYVIESFSKWVIESGADVIIAPEARGFLIASALAFNTSKKLVLARKPKKLPRRVIKQEYEYEYNKNILEVHKDDIIKGEKVFIVDDVLATGETIVALTKIMEKMDANIVGIGLILKLNEFNSIDKIKKYHCNILI